MAISNISMNNVTNPTTLPLKKADAGVTAPVSQDTVSISSGKDPKEKKSVAKQIFNTVSDIRESTIGKIAMDTAIGAVTGAAVMAIGMSPAAMAVASAVVTGVALGAVGAAVGGFGGFLLGGAAGKDAGKNASKWALITGGTMAAGGAAVGYFSGLVQGSFLTKLAASVGGGPLGGAIAGAVLSGGWSAVNSLMDGKKEAAKGNI